MYLTIGVADVHLTRVHVAQARVPVGDDSVDGLNVEIVTTKIDDLAAFSPGNKVFAGLFPRRLDIDGQYRCADFGSADLSTLYSLDMWGDGFRQVAYNRQAPSSSAPGALAAQRRKRKRLWCAPRRHGSSSTSPSTRIRNTGRA